MNDTHSLLKNKTRAVIAPCLPETMDNICIVDPPSHTNVGDSAIFAGELDFLRQNYPSARLWFFDLNNYSHHYDKHIKGTCLLAFHGGGNFGDLWPAHHQFRLSILESFPEIPKIQFPQSICFENNELLQRTQKAIAKQKNYRLFVRDNSSFEFAKEHFDCETYLCPDMAFSLRPLQRPEAELDYFCLLRTDKERLVDKSSLIANTLASHSSSYKIDDWIEPDQSIWTSFDKSLTRLGRRYPQMIRFTQKPSLYIRENFAWMRLHRGINMLGSGQQVITDRLHGHILATLLGIPHFIFDSFDGKISAFHKTWLSDNTNVKFMNSFEEFLINQTY